MDGAASVMALVVCAASSAIGLVQGDAWLAIAGAALCGACLGFLPHNLASPARIFLGDGGSMPIGFAVAALVMVGSADAVPAWQALVVGLLLVGVPALDTAWSWSRAAGAGLDPHRRARPPDPPHPALAAHRPRGGRGARRASRRSSPPWRCSPSPAERRSSCSSSSSTSWPPRRRSRCSRPPTATRRRPRSPRRPRRARSRAARGARRPRAAAIACPRARRRPGAQPVLRRLLRHRALAAARPRAAGRRDRGGDRPAPASEPARGGTARARRPGRVGAAVVGLGAVGLPGHHGGQPLVRPRRDPRRGARPRPHRRLGGWLTGGWSPAIAPWPVWVARAHARVRPGGAVPRRPPRTSRWATSTPRARSSSWASGCARAGRARRRGCAASAPARRR